MANQKERKQQQSVGLSFAGGGVQAWAEVAAYADLERQGVAVDAVAGTSMGSFLAAAVASGLSAAEIYQMIRETDEALEESSLFGAKVFFSLFSLRQPLGLVLTEKIVEVIEPIDKIYGELMLSDVPKPLAIPAVDIISNKLIIFSNQPEYFQTVYEEAEFYKEDVPLIKACLASSAYPIILSPVEIKTHQLVDGGVWMNSPSALFSKEKLDYVIALRLPVLEKAKPAEKRLEVALRALSIMVGNQEEDMAQHADLHYFLDVELPGMFNFGDSEPIIQAGEKFVAENPIDTTEIFGRKQRDTAARRKTKGIKKTYYS